ncbi:MAG: hypothetical protein IPK16_14715 [Anaerolineales bacterium]|nr:hypothetical protein [Anaerolineales bacterium]
MLALTSAPVMAQGEPDPDALILIIESIGFACVRTSKLTTNNPIPFEVRWTLPK